MVLPFTTQQFFAVFASYNEAVWPAQVVLLALALAAMLAIALQRSWSDRLVSGILALLWLWLALAYHLAFFAAINPLAYVFAGLSAVGAAVFAWHGVFRQRLRFRFTSGTRGAAGAALVVYALVVYPLWSVYAGHGYPAMPTFGLPCPTTLFTIGLLAFAIPPYPRSVPIAPVVWALVGAQAAFLLGVLQDLGLLVAAAVGAFLIVRAYPQAGRLVP